MSVSLRLFPMILSFFGGGGGRGFRTGKRGESERGGFHNARQLGRRQQGNMPMNNIRQNEQTDRVASSLRLNSAQTSKLHDLVHGKGWGYQRILSEAKKHFGID